VGRGDSETTEVRSRPELPRLGLDEQQGFYRRAGALLELDDEGPPEPGFRLFWGRKHDVAWRDLPATDGSHAIVGRHPCCQIRLADDREISLRHLLATAHLLDDGAVALRLINLRASLPFFLDDDTPRWSLVAAGPVVLRLGSYVLVGVPVGAGAASRLPNHRFRELPSYHKTEAPALSPSPLRAAAPAAAGPRRAQSEEISHITISPRITDIGAVSESSPTDAFAQLTVQGDGAGAQVGISEADLRLGVLIGRSEKCLDRGVTAILSKNISRAHLLLLREETRTCAYDLGSTNGTRVDGVEASWVVLPRSTTLELGQGDVIRLRWREL
jgi:hypothetical protein